MARKQEELLLSVADITLIDNATGVEYATASLKSHNISQSVDTSEIRAGRKNAVITTLESNKTITVELEDVHANRDWLAIAMDTELNEGTSVKIRVLPQKLNNACCEIYGDNIYIFGGANSSNISVNTIYKFNCKTETIETLSTTLPQKLKAACCEINGDNIYIFGGMNNNDD